jgi:hypothetical protein
LHCFDLPTLQKAVKQATIRYKDFPPTLGQLVDLCVSNSGMPCKSDVLNMMIRREFNHPLAQICFDKIGSWTLSHANEDEVNQKMNEAYKEAIGVFMRQPMEAWDALGKFKAERETLPPPPITKAEFLSWRDRLAQYRQRAAEDKAKLPNMEHPKWNKDKLIKGSPLYDELVFNERKKYLMGLDEWMAGTLDSADWYDRVCYFREIEAQDYLRDIKLEQEAKKDRAAESEFRRSGGGAKRAGNYYGD